jgi:hypothetical protein
MPASRNGSSCVCDTEDVTNFQPPSGSNWPNPPRPPEKPRLGLWARIGLIFGGIVVFGTVVGLANQDSPAPVAAPSAPSATRTAPTYTAPTYSPPTYSAPIQEVPTAPDGSFSNGIYEVGDEVAPGEYKSAGPEPGAFSLCYVHVKSGGKYLEQKVVNDGQIRIEILSSWAGAELDVSGCQPFAKVD